MQQKIKKISWGEIEVMVEKLSSRIREADFQPDYLIGITVGGLIPLAMLAKELDIKSMVTISATSYEKDKQGELRILYLPEIDLSDKKVLLIDELADTGKTLKKISQIIIDKYKIAELKTATLAINKEKCAFQPDFFVMEESAWFIFPWERNEFPEYINS